MASTSSTIHLFTLSLLILILTPTNSQWTPTSAYSEAQEYSSGDQKFSLPSVDVQKYVCKGANNTEIVIGGDSYATTEQLGHARTIYANMCEKSPTFRALLKSRFPGLQTSDRNYMQYTLSARPGQQFSYGSFGGLGMIDIYASGQNLKFKSGAGDNIPEGLDEQDLFVHDNFVSIVAHETSHMGPGFDHSTDMYLPIALVISEMKADSADPPKDADPSPNPMPEECQTLGILKYIKGEGPKCGILPSA